MKPENVNPRNFEVVEIIYDNDAFSVVYGKSKDGNNHVAMRWNGDDNNDKGYPKTFGNPMWFILNDDLKLPILKALLNEKNSINCSILKVLNDEL